MDPLVKINMKLKKKYLIYKARERGINTSNKTKLQLSKEIANFDSLKFSMNWKSISK